MKEKLTRNLGLKLISLFCAFFVWLAVVNVANPEKMGYQDVKVEIVNEGVLDKSNLTYEIVGKDTATVNYKVRTKDAYKIKASDFRVYADLSEMYDVTGAIPIKVEVLKNAELIRSPYAVTVTPEVIKIRTEEVQTKEFKLRANPYGTPADGYVAGALTMSPDSVFVRGPVSQIGQISSVGIEFSVDGAVSDVSGAAAAILMDANGNGLNLGDSVTVLSGDIQYALPILKKKDLPLDFAVTGEVKSGYRYTGVECEVKSVPVAGLKSALASLNTVTVQSPELNIDGATADKTCEIDLAKYVDESVQIVGMENTKVKVTLKVEPLREKTYDVNTKDIAITGKSDEYDYSLIGDKETVRIRGLKEDLDSLSTAKMNISADVTSMTPGTHEVKASMLLDGAYEVVEYPMCQMQVTLKADTPKETEDTKPSESTKAAETVNSTVETTENSGE